MPARTRMLGPFCKKDSSLNFAPSRLILVFIAFRLFIVTRGLVVAQKARVRSSSLCTTTTMGRGRGNTCVCIGLHVQVVITVARRPSYVLS